MMRKMVLLCFGFLSLGLPFTARAQEGTVELRQWAISATATSQYGDTSWSAMQAAGVANTIACGDLGTAWASASSTEQAALTVMFAIAVKPTQVNIHQSYNPGAITGIELILSDGGTVISVSNSADPGGGPCPGILTINILEEVPLVEGVIIYLDQSITGDWNEIDAVELVGRARLGSEVSMWADYGMASSQYGNESWGASQVIGLPNTSDCGDIPTAWASASAQGVDQLLVFFPHLVVPSRLDIYQSYNPGAIVQIDLIASDGSLVPITNSADPGTPCPGVMTLEIKTDVIAFGAIIHLDQSITGSWNEIDAVQMTGALADDGLVRQWAADAAATSQYREDSWSAMQAVGAPNTFACGDIPTAWASASATGTDALTVFFDESVIPTSVYVYQTYNPGAITGMELIPADGSQPITVSGFSGDVFVSCPGILIVDIEAGAPPINGVTIYLDQNITGSWNEIDAVRLIGEPTLAR